ncbi:uncharacterized protein LOC125054632 [Pieris napi]|uniref:uncharacterized protein LOC125054632 n=1 Tax=Pieris napi TaxID=78633 RepID=UPI001FBB202E|nr:uncharacterized protein LOC125054632 [Pieris napi]
MLYKCINFIIFCQFLCGFYVKLSKFYMTFLSTLYIILFSIFVVYGIYIKPFSSFFFFWSNIYSMIDYIICFSVTFINRTVFVSKFLKMMSELDGKLERVPSTFSIKIILFFFAVFMEKIYYAWQYQETNDKSTFMYKLSIIAWIMYKYGSCFNINLRNILFELTRQRIIALRESFERNMKNDVVDKVEEINKTLAIYKMILNMINSYGLIVKYYVIRDFCTTFFYLIILAIGASFNIHKNFRWYRTVNGVTNILMACLPCIIFQGAINEVENIKTILTTELLKCSPQADERHTRQKIKDAVKYLEINPLRFTIFRLFNLNMTLPFLFISLCSTYVIVSLQFY